MPRQFKVTVNGREYDVSVLEVTSHQPTATPVPVTSFAGAAAVAPSVSTTPTAPAHAAGSQGDVLAGMGGVVVAIHVKVSQSVAAGDHLMTLEAMKMKTPVTAPNAGRISRILVDQGAAVEAGQPLVTIA